MAARAARRGPSSTESIPKPAADAGGADFVDLEGLALRRAIELGDGHWEERGRTAHDALAATPLPPRGEPGPPFQRRRMLHQQFHLAIKALDDHLALPADNIIHQNRSWPRIT